MKITFVGAVGIVVAIVVAILAIRYLLNRGNDGPQQAES